jgi:hypothetical protein
MTSNSWVWFQGCWLIGITPYETLRPQKVMSSNQMVCICNSYQPSTIELDLVVPMVCQVYFCTSNKKLKNHGFKCQYWSLKYLPTFGQVTFLEWVRSFPWEYTFKISLYKQPNHIVIHSHALILTPNDLMVIEC